MTNETKDYKNLSNYDLCSLDTTTDDDNWEEPIGSKENEAVIEEMAKRNMF